MTRYTEPYPTGHQRRFPSVDERVDPSGRLTSMHQPATKHRSRLRTAGIVAAFVLSLALFAAGGFYFAHTLIAPSPHEEASRADTTVIFAGQQDQLVAPAGNTVQRDSSDPSVVWVRSSIKMARSRGSTDGVSVKVPTTLSERMQGKRIRVTVSAKRGDDHTSPFALAYSAGTANSGWVVFDPTAEFKDFNLSFVVPAKAAGSDQYVGIWSDIAGRGAPLAIRQLAITILP